MNWYLSHSEYEQQKGEGNKLAMKMMVDEGRVPGLLAMLGGDPAGWIALSPRQTYPTLARSRILKAVDALPVWSIVCFFVAKPHRRQGLSVALLRAAIDYVQKQGGEVLEGYPQEPQKGEMPPVFAFTGLASAFRQAGFVEVARRSPSRPIMRYTIPTPK